MKPSSSGETKATTYTNFPDNVLEVILLSSLSKPAIKLYIYYRKYRHNRQEVAWPSFRRIQKEVAISKSDIVPARQELVDAGLISVTKGGYLENTQISFHDDVVVSYVGTRGGLPGDDHPGLPGGDQGDPPGGDTTITNTNTNTITNNTNTKGSSKKKKSKKKSVPSRSPRRSKSPGANNHTKRVVSQVGITPKQLLRQKTKPTFEQYLKAKGNEWDWAAFLGKWEELHSNGAKT